MCLKKEKVLHSISFYIPPVKPYRPISSTAFTDLEKESF